MHATSILDMEDDLPFDSTPVQARPMAEIAQPRLATVQPAPALYRSTCGKCGGSGKYHGPSPYGRHCFPCGGSGYMSYKSSPESRDKARAQRAERAERKARESLETFAQENPAMHAWMVAKAPSFDFAASMLEAVRKWGDLTEGQRGAVGRCMERDAARDAERAARAAERAAAPVVRLDALHDVMQRHSKFYAGEITLSRARDTSTVWIKHSGAEKAVGKIEHGALTMWTRPGVDMDAIRATLTEFEGAPLQAAMRFGKMTGRCCSCGRELTDPASIEAGIGPICATKF